MTVTTHGYIHTHTMHIHETCVFSSLIWSTERWDFLFFTRNGMKCQACLALLIRANMFLWTNTCFYYLCIWSPRWRKNLQTEMIQESSLVYGITKRFLYFTRIKPSFPDAWNLPAMCHGKASYLYRSGSFWKQAEGTWVTFTFHISISKSP